MPSLFDGYEFGDFAVRNRIVMAPLTRDRAGPGRTPTPLMATYYAQRSSAGLIVSEATQISAEGQGYLDTPGIYSVEQVEAWRKTTTAVHAFGGKMVLQLWHVGRISHLSLLPDGVQPVSSTTRIAKAKTFTAQGFESVSEPRALSVDEMPRVVEDYRKAARHAVDAGFDGVEVHCANGYLLEQFLRDSINDRTDAYGGSVENRCRLPLDVLAAITNEIGPGKTGIRLSPVTPVNDAGQDSDAQGLFDYFVERFSKLQLAYVHVIEGATGGSRDDVKFDFAALRERFKRGSTHGAWIVNNGYSRDMAIAAIESRAADLIAFGRPFISNPDLVSRLERNLPLTPLDQKTLYGGGAEGYTDYPSADVASRAQ